MQTRMIPPEQWIEFFDQFNRDHAGWPVSIELLDNINGPQKVADHLPLDGISFDTKGTRPCSMAISAGGERSPHVEHVIDLPMDIEEAQDTVGNVDVRIAPASGPPTLMHFRAPVH